MFRNDGNKIDEISLIVGIAQNHSKRLTTSCKHDMMIPTGKHVSPMLGEKGEQMKAINGTAIYTGDGYSVIGKTDAGWFFHGTSDGWLEILSDDPRSLDEHGDMLCFDAEWTEKNCVANVNTEAACNMIVDFCKRLDAEEEGITEGYDDFSNYIPGEVTRYITKSLQVC